MAQLSGSQTSQLQAALLAAFDQAELSQMVKVELGEDLDSIAGGGKLAAVVFSLIQWAERRQRMGDLLCAAQAQRPENGVFAALAGESGAVAPNATPQVPAARPPSEPEGISIGNVNAGGGTFVGRDHIVHGDVVQGDKVGGDKVGGDKITTGDIGGTNIAVGRGASVFAGAGDLAGALAPVVAAIRQNADAAQQAAAMQEIEALKQELAKGKDADDARVAGILDGLANLVPGAVAAVVSAFGTPLLAGLAGPVTQFVLGQLKRRQV